MEIIWIILLVLIIWFLIKPRKEHFTSMDFKKEDKFVKNMIKNKKNNKKIESFQRLSKKEEK